MSTKKDKDRDKDNEKDKEKHVDSLNYSKKSISGVVNLFFQGVIDRMTYVCYSPAQRHPKLC